MIVVGANLAMDRTLRLDALRPGHVQRPRTAVMTAGGKAVNVCRAAVAHAVRPRLVANLPGVLGGYVGDLLEAEGHDVRRVATSGEIRAATIILDDLPRTTVLNEPGPPLSPADRDALLDAVEQELAQSSSSIQADQPVGARVCICTGSLPPGTDDGFYGLVVDMARAHGLTSVLDAARAALAAALPHHPDIVTPNLSEALGVLALLRGEAAATLEAEGNEDDDLAHVRRQAAGAAQALVDAGAGAALVTAGRHGVAGVDGGGAFWVSAPAVTVVNSIGAGDCFVAGLAAALEAGHDLRGAVVLAVASASASVTTELAGDVDVALLHSLAGTLRVESTVSSR